MTETQRIIEIIENNAPMNLQEIIGTEIEAFTQSAAYKTAEDGEQYLRNRSAVQDKQVKFSGRSNCKDEHPILRKLIEQKVNYLLSRPFSVECENKTYAEQLSGLFDSGFRRQLKVFGRSAPKYGIGFMQPYIDQRGALKVHVYPFTAIKPLWLDDEHTELGGFIHFFQQTVYVVKEKRTITRAELWSAKGVQHFLKEQSGRWEVDPQRPKIQPHFYINNTPYTWNEVPLLWVRYNEEELPLFYFIRELIDSQNWNVSITDDVLRDVANFIYILKGYGGADINQFVRELRQAMAIRLQSDGGLDKMEANLNLEAVMKFIDNLRRSIYDYGNGVDTKDPELGSASGRAIAFRYTDLDNDCQNLALELQEAFSRLKYFVDQFLKMTGKGDFSGEAFSITFNTDMPVNESEIVDNLTKLSGARPLASQRTLIGQLPFIRDVDAELQQLATEEQEEQKRQNQRLNLYAFPEENALLAGGEGNEA